MRHTGLARSSLLPAALLIVGGRVVAQSPVVRFEQRYEALRTQSRIPAISVVIAQGQRIVWSKSFGQADLETGRRATDTTVYHLASITKPIASTVILQLVEEGKLSLDDPVSKYGVSLDAAAPILVRHLLSHTSEGTPGTTFRYNGNRFARLDTIVAQVTGMPFARALQQRIIAKLGLRHIAPNPQSPSFSVAGQSAAAFDANFARGYTSTDSGHRLTNYPPSFSVSAGLTASALDVAAFSMAMDRDALLKPETKARAWTPAVSPAGDTLPYALGWFSTRYEGVRVVWQYGLWTAISSLLLKVPDRDLTLVILANSDGLSAPYRLGGGQLESSPWAREFLDRFVIRKDPLPASR